jgi:hypothetical protein
MEQSTWSNEDRKRNAAPISLWQSALWRRRANMDQPVLGDKNQFPTEKVIFSHIGKAKALWKLFFDHLHTEHPDFTEEWRYYNDGKSWLMKVTRKSKTVFWLSIIQDAFRVTCYFTEKAAPAIEGSAISAELKKQFKDAKSFGKIRGLTILFKDKGDVENARAMISLKLSLK